MTDDYQYQPQPLPTKNEGLFGYGGKPNEGSRGFQGQIVDFGGGVGGGDAGVGGGGGIQGPQGPEGPQGPQGPQGPAGPFIGGTNGDMLYHNGTAWVTLANSGRREALLSMTSSNVPFWLTSSGNNSILYYSSTLGWFPLEAPSGEGPFVLGFSGGSLQWLQTTDCGATGP